MTPRLHRVASLKLYFLPVRTRMPLKFGPETLTSATCLRVAMEVVDEDNRRAEGWGETPLSVQWVWPSQVAYATRHETLKQFCGEVARAWMQFPLRGHALEAGYDFQEQSLGPLFAAFNRRTPPLVANSIVTPSIDAEPMPWLAALVCNSAFDLALHDAFGRLAC